MTTKMFAKFFCVMLMLTVMTPSMSGFASNTKKDIMIYIDRKDKMLYVLKDNGEILYQFQCGIGRGGVKIKKSMSDYVTPTGEFKVDIVLYGNNEYADVSDDTRERYSKGEYVNYFKKGNGLAKLFQNMNSIDFDNDGKPDKAYGIAYVGLDSLKAVTGPKMQKYGDLPYWFSIAIHGTQNETYVGDAKSGGCIYLRAADLALLIENRILEVDRRVSISDSSPHGVLQK